MAMEMERRVAPAASIKLAPPHEILVVEVPMLLSTPHERGGTQVESPVEIPSIVGVPHFVAPLELDRQSASPTHDTPSPSPEPEQQTHWEE